MDGSRSALDVNHMDEERRSRAQSPVRSADRTIRFGRSERFVSPALYSLASDPIFLNPARVDVAADAVLIIRRRRSVFSNDSMKRGGGKGDVNAYTLKILAEI